MVVAESYDVSAAIEAAKKPALRKLLTAALDTGAVWPAFQPIVDIQTGAVASFEILARWTDPGGEVISPGTFIPRLETQNHRPAFRRPHEPCLPRSRLLDG